VQGERAAAGGASQQQEVACFSVAQVHVLLAECARNPDRCRFPALMTASSAPAGPRSFRLQASRIAPEGPQGGGGDDRVVTVTVCEMNFAEGCLGWRVWCCALILADWLLCTPAICRGHTVLELGSGLGLPGMLAAKLGAKAVSLTDCLPLMLKSLHRVVRDNGLAKTTSVHTLDWVTDSGADSQKCSARFGSSAETNEALQQREQEAAGEAWPHLPIGQQFELVMGSDVMYETHHIECLVAVLASRCAVGSRCIFVNPVRGLSVPSRHPSIGVASCVGGVYYLLYYAWPRPLARK
jgi:predicted nicotinamide N-methyase